MTERKENQAASGRLHGKRMHGGRMRGMKPSVKNPGQVIKRLMGYVFQRYGFWYMVVIVLIFAGVLANVQGTMFMKNLIDEYITPFLMTDHPDFTPLARAIGRWLHSMLPAWRPSMRTTALWLILRREHRGNLGMNYLNICRSFL